MNERQSVMICTSACLRNWEPVFPWTLCGQTVTLIDDLFDRLLTVKCFLTFQLANFLVSDQFSDTVLVRYYCFSKVHSIALEPWGGFIESHDMTVVLHEWHLVDLTVSIMSFVSVM